MPGTRPFLDDIPTYEIRDGTMHIIADGFELAMPLRKFRLGMARAAKVLASYDAHGEVVPIKRKRDKAVWILWMVAGAAADMATQGVM